MRMDSEVRRTVNVVRWNVSGWADTVRFPVSAWMRLRGQMYELKRNFANILRTPPNCSETAFQHPI